MEQIDIIKEKVKSLGRTFVGATELWYPTYMVHLDFEKPNDDPMYPIDWAIMHFIKDMPKVDKTSVARIIGMEPSLVEYRIKYLCAQDDLMYNSDYGHYEILSKGEKDFFSPDGSVMYIHGSKDLLIDGNKLSIMDEKVYSARSMIRAGYKSDIVENVTVTKDGRPMRMLLRKLESMTNANKAKLDIPADSRNFETTDEPTFGSIKIYFVFSVDQKGEACKDIFYNDDFIKIPYYSNDIHKYFFGRNLDFTHGFTNYEEKNLKNRIFDLSTETICSILQNLYKWKIIDESYYTYKTYSYYNSRPLTVNVNLKSFLASRERKALKEDIKYGEVDYLFGDSVITLSVVTQDPELRKLLAFDEKVEDLYVKQGVEKLISWLCESNLAQNRKNLISLQRYDILEKMDNYLFIQSN
jgi:hypothetical protein